MTAKKGKDSADYQAKSAALLGALAAADNAKTAASELAKDPAVASAITAFDEGFAATFGMPSTAAATILIKASNG